jgi:hypothetical protein
MRTAYEWFTEYLEICGSSSIGKLWQCPSHADSFPSLSVNEAADARVLIKCFAGCEWEEVLQSLSLPSSVLFQPHLRSPQKLLDSLVDKPSISAFEWRTAKGKNGGGEWWDGYGRSTHISEQFHYFTPTVRQWRRRYSNGAKLPIWQVLENGRWVGRNGQVRLPSLPLYRTEIVTLARASGELIVLCESESSVDALEEVGISATTWAGGASSPQKAALLRELAGCNVLYIGDNDKAGLKCVTLLESFLPTATSAWNVLFGEENEDARDMLNRGALDFLLAPVLRF